MSGVSKAKRRPYGYKVIKFISEFSDLYYDGVRIICRVCQIDLLCWDKYGCKRHVNCARHINKKNGVPSKTQFMLDLLLMLIACDIPPHILDKQPFQEFWNKYNPQVRLPSRAALGKYVPTVHEDIVNKIKCVLKNTRLWLCVGEMTDCKKNSVLNVIVRVLDPIKSTFPLLLASKRLTECTSKTITRVVLETLEKFELSTSQLLMFVTDDTTTMSSVGCSLQEHGCRLVHVTCKVHALHLVSETIRQSFPEVDVLIASTKKVFLKPGHSKCPGIPEPPQSSLTRWGTWLKQAFYYADYFQQIKSVILHFNPDEQLNSVETALKTIRKNYKRLHDAIEKLQNSKLSLEESLLIVDEANRQLQVIGDSKNECVREKLASVLKKDTGYIRLRQIYDGASPDTLTVFRDYFKFACITSFDAERSFSKYNHIFLPQRSSLTEATMETYLMLHSFYRSPVFDNQAS